MIKACIFDLDGTVMDTLKALNKTMNETLKELGLGSISLEQTKMFVGSGYVAYIKSALEYSGDKDYSLLTKAKEIYEKNFEKYATYEVLPYKGVRMALGELKNRGIKLAILSNKEQFRTKDTIYTFFDEEFFDRIYGEREGIPLKPDPKSLELLIKELGVEKEECLYFGDTKVDMETARNAGVKKVAVLWGFRDEGELSSYNPEYIIKSGEEILSCIE